MRAPRRVLLDVADQVDVAQAVALFPPQLGANRIHQFGDEPLVQVTHRRPLSHSSATRRMNVDEQANRESTQSITDRPVS